MAEPRMLIRVPSSTDRGSSGSTRYWVDVEMVWARQRDGTEAEGLEGGENDVLHGVRFPLVDLAGVKGSSGGWVVGMGRQPVGGWQGQASDCL